MVHENAIPVQSSLGDIGPLADGDLLAVFAPIRAEYRQIVDETQAKHCRTTARRLLAKRRQLYRAALAHALAAGEWEAGER